MFLARRYLGGSRRRGFAGVVTLLAAMGVALGVAALIIVLSVMAGFEGDLKDKIIGARAHIVVEPLRGVIEDPQALRKKLLSHPDIVAASMYTFATVLMKTPARTTGAALWGIDPNEDTKAIGLDGSMISGKLSKLQGNKKTIILGEELRRSLGLNIGDTLTVLAPSLRFTGLGFLPRWRKFKVVGTFQTGMYEYDSSFGYIHINQARDFLDLGQASDGLALLTRDVDEAPRIALGLLQSLPDGLWAQDWQRKNRNLFTALKIERRVMFLILLLIVLVAAFNIITGLVMVVMEKEKEIAILRAQGMSKKAITRIFVIAGGIIGLVGTLTGMALGLLGCYFIARTGIQIPGGGSVYYIENLPVRVDPWLALFWIPFTALLICFLSAVYPAMRAVALDPAEVVRHD